MLRPSRGVTVLLQHRIELSERDFGGIHAAEPKCSAALPPGVDGARVGVHHLPVAVLLYQIQEVDLFTESGNLSRKYPTAIITHRAAKTA